MKCSSSPPMKTHSVPRRWLCKPFARDFRDFTGTPMGAVTIYGRRLAEASASNRNNSVLVTGVMNCWSLSPELLSDLRMRS